MKPDADALTGMEEEEENPEKLFVDLGKLVVYARQPEESVKGRKEGIHCPPFNPNDRQSHDCSADNEECVKTKQMVSEIELLWHNRIPMSIEVLLYPDCYPRNHAGDVSSYGNGAKPQCVLLEQWTILIVGRRSSSEACLSGCMLVQAVRSYLHFSQLSSWYSSTHGKQPAAVVCRVCAPGESFANYFEGAIDSHDFPKAYLDRTSSMKVSVKSLKRQKEIPKLVCLLPHFTDTEENHSNGVHTNKTYTQQNQVQSVTTQTKNTGARRKQYTPADISGKENKLRTKGTTQYTPVDSNNKDRELRTNYLSQCTPVDFSNKFDFSTKSRNDSFRCFVPSGDEEQVGYAHTDVQKPKTNLQAKKFGKFNHNAMQGTDYGADFTSLYSERDEDVEQILEELSLCERTGSFRKHLSKSDDDDFVLFRKREAKCEMSGHTSGKPSSSLLSTVLRKFTDKNIVGLHTNEEHVSEKEHQQPQRYEEDNEENTHCECVKPQCVQHRYEERGMVRSKTSPSLATLGQRSLVGIPNTVFNPRTGLPINSSPAPPRRINRYSCDFDRSMTNLNDVSFDDNSPFNRPLDASTKLLSKSAPPSTSSLLGNFEECVLNGRFEPVGTVDGFTADIGASGTFCPKHMILPVTAYFFDVSDDNAPSPYLGHIGLESLGKKGYHVPKKGTVQVTLFNPNKTVVKMFIVMYDLTDMPPNCQTFIRQRTFYMRNNAALIDDNNDSGNDYNVRQLRYLIHLRFMSTKSGHIYLHTDIRLIFARHRVDVDSGIMEYELKSFTEMPSNPRFSPKK
ncbi:atos homolog protein A-like [Glandiceps talaboti]